MRLASNTLDVAAFLDRVASGEQLQEEEGPHPTEQQEVGAEDEQPCRREEDARCEVEGAQAR